MIVTWHYKIWQWDIVPSMGRRWTRSRVDARGPMARNGGAPRMHTRTPSTVSATCTVAATVQESLWNLKLTRSHHPPSHHSLLQEAAAAAVVEVQLRRSKTFRCMPLAIPKAARLLELIKKPTTMWTTFPLGSQAKITGTSLQQFTYYAKFVVKIIWSEKGQDLILWWTKKSKFCLIDLIWPLVMLFCGWYIWSARWILECFCCIQLSLNGFYVGPM